MDSSVSQIRAGKTPGMSLRAQAPARNGHHESCRQGVRGSSRAVLCEETSRPRLTSKKRDLNHGIHRTHGKRRGMLERYGIRGRETGTRRIIQPPNIPIEHPLTYYNYVILSQWSCLLPCIPCIPWFQSVFHPCIPWFQSVSHPRTSLRHTVPMMPAIPNPIASRYTPLGSGTAATPTPEKTA